MQYDGRKLKTLIDDQGRRYRWVAEQVGIDPSYLSKMFSNERRIKPSLAFELAEILGVPAHTFSAESKELVAR